MDYRLKCACMHALGALPFGSTVHYLTQRYVTRSIPRPERDVQDSLPWALQHIQTFKEHDGDLKRGNYYEFGAGWDLFTNLVFYTLGIEHQLVVDLRPYARRELVNHVIRLLRDIEVPGRVHTVLGELDDNFVESLREKYGITYLAPCNAAALQVQDGKIDLISSTNTMEHIPEQDIRRILRECFRICHGDSVVSMIIDYSDHYAHADEALTSYNYLRFDDKQWRRLNPPIHYQNRLRHSDYVRLFEEAGFRIVKETSRTPAAGAAQLAAIDLAERFKSYESSDLLKLSGHFVLRKASQ